MEEKPTDFQIFLSYWVNSVSHLFDVEKLVAGDKGLTTSSFSIRATPIDYHILIALYRYIV